MNALEAITQLSLAIGFMQYELNTCKSEGLAANMQGLVEVRELLRQQHEQQQSTPGSAKIRVDKEDLEEFMKLFLIVSNQLNMYGDEPLAQECDQTAEFIEGYYLPYPEKEEGHV